MQAEQPPQRHPHPTADWLADCAVQASRHRHVRAIVKLTRPPTDQSSSVRFPTQRNTNCGSSGGTSAAGMPHTFKMPCIELCGRRDGHTTASGPPVAHAQRIPFHTPPSDTTQTEMGPPWLEYHAAGKQSRDAQADRKPECEQIGKAPSVHASHGERRSVDDNGNGAFQNNAQSSARSSALRLAQAGFLRCSASQ